MRPGKRYGGPQDGLVTAYEIGRCLNRIRWCLDQAVFCSTQFWDKELPPLLHELISIVRRLLNDPTNALIEGRIHDEIRLWSEGRKGEWFAEEYNTTISNYNRWAKDGFSNEPDDTALTSRGQLFAQDVRSLIREAIGDKSLLMKAIGFGIIVDQGIRPNDCTRFIFREKLNPTKVLDRKTIGKAPGGVGEIP